MNEENVKNEVVTEEVTKVEETPLSNGKTLKELASELNRTQNLYCQDKACTELGKAFMCAGVGIAIVCGTIMGLTKGANSACIAALSGFMVSCFGFVCCVFHFSFVLLQVSILFLMIRNVLFHCKFLVIKK